MGVMYFVPLEMIPTGVADDAPMLVWRTLGFPAWKRIRHDQRCGITDDVSVMIIGNANKSNKRLIELAHVSLLRCAE